MGSHLGKLVEEARRSLGWTRPDLAKAVGYKNKNSMPFCTRPGRGNTSPRPGFARTATCTERSACRKACCFCRLDLPFV